MTFSTECLVTGVCFILAIMLTFVSYEAYMPVFPLDTHFALIYVLEIFIAWFIVFYALAYKLKT